MQLLSSFPFSFDVYFYLQHANIHLLLRLSLLLSDNLVYNIVSAVVIGIPILLSGYLVFLVRSCHDNLRIQKEFKCWACILVILLLVYLGFVIPFLKYSSNLRNIFMTFLTSFGAFISNFIFTFLPLYWYRKLYDVASSQRRINRRKSSENKLNFIQVLENKDGYEMFAEYLVKEFSIEVNFIENVF